MTRVSQTQDETSMPRLLFHFFSSYCFVFLPFFFIFDFSLFVWNLKHLSWRFCIQLTPYQFAKRPSQPLYIILSLFTSNALPISSLNLPFKAIVLSLGLGKDIVLVQGLKEWLTKRMVTIKA